MNTATFKLSGNIVDIVQQKIFPGTLQVENGIIVSIKEEAVDESNYILPGLIDSHIHIESSMLIPSEFARLAVVHGTVATVSDPHEIGNVLGIDGIRFMIRNGLKTHFKFYFGASSCVPATTFETAGANIGVDGMDELLQMNEIKYMSEMMNYPGVLSGDPEVMAKIAVARKYNKPVDGHAPGLRGDDARRYIEAGISTDHECFTIEEALDKLRYGMKILIREGSAAKNFEALVDLLQDHADHVMFCSDDRHPNDLVKEHVNSFVKRAVGKGYDPLRVLKSCIYNPVKHYKLDVGLLQAGDDADLIVVNDLYDFDVLQTYIRGRKVAENGKTLLDSVVEQPHNKFHAEKLTVEDIRLIPESEHIRVIEAMDGQLITHSLSEAIRTDHNNAISDTAKDVLKLVVLNRYQPAKPAVAFIKSFGLKRGAIASSVAHDSHNIIAVGTSDKEIVEAINLLVECKGGISLVDGPENMVIPLHVAGLMSTHDGYQVASLYDAIDKKAKSLGSSLNAPFMTLSFMALLVIPDLKLSDKGLFDGRRFQFTSVFRN